MKLYYRQLKGIESNTRCKNMQFSMAKIIRSLGFCWSLIFSVTLLAEAQGTYYRYKDRNGNVVINRTIPANMVKYGYEVLSDSGRVLKIVDRQKTKEELKLYEAQRSKEQLEKESVEKQREYDLKLLRRYSFVSDIESERDRKIKEMEVRVQILRGNLLGVRNELEVEYANAARMEKSGRSVSEVTKKRIGDFESKLTTTEQLMNKLISDMDITKKEYLLAIERFKELQILRGR